MNIVVKVMLDTLYFPGQEVNQHSSTSSSASYFVLSWTRSKPTFFNIIFSVLNMLLSLSFPGQEVDQYNLQHHLQHLQHHLQHASLG